MIYIKSIIRNGRLILLPILVLFSGCGDSVLDDLINGIEPAGVTVLFREDLSSANSMAASDTTDVSLLVMLKVDGVDHTMAVKDNKAWITWVDLNVGLGSHYYELSIFFPQSGDVEPILLAHSNQTTNVSRIKFTASMLHVTPYDVDESGGDLNQQERQLLDTDEET
ncbi:MAG: hypothetical protein ACC707_10490 [Thiohalomonadales bacterium]